MPHGWLYRRADAMLETVRISLLGSFEIMLRFSFRRESCLIQSICSCSRVLFGLYPFRNLIRRPPSSIYGSVFPINWTVGNDDKELLFVCAQQHLCWVSERKESIPEQPA